MDPKAGWKTTEFWLNLAAIVVAYLMTTDMGSDPDSITGKVLTALAAVLTAFGYTVARSVVKARLTGRQ